MSDIFEFEDKAKVERLIGTLHDPAATPGDVLTVQADKSIAAQPGGGSGGVQTVTVPVSSAQILDLFNTPVVLIPGVAGNVIVVNGYNIAYVAGLVPYLDGGGNIVAQLGATLTVLVLSAGAGFWDQAASQIYGLGYGFASLGGASSVFDGIDLLLLEDTANPTLGDGTLLVTVSYFLAPVA